MAPALQSVRGCGGAIPPADSACASPSQLPTPERPFYPEGRMGMCDGPRLSEVSRCVLLRIPAMGACGLAFTSTRSTFRSCSCTAPALGRDGAPR